MASSPGGLRTPLQFEIQRPGPQAATVHRAQDLDLADRIEAEARRDSVFHDLDDLRGRVFGVAAGHEMEIALRVPRPVGHPPLVMRWALAMIRLSAAWRKISVSRTIGTAPEPMMSASTWPGPTDGSWSTS